MQRVEDPVDRTDKVFRWRRDTLMLLFPEMEVGRCEELAAAGDRELLETARRLAEDGCPAELAYDILR